ncbi:PREDICTED: E3 ubiquitin-protein ligase SMURF1 [Thamnophis sirtalis]|uniref:HECT-type E3 ubiquitin transferase n=1 Tax=Thamnophis sirtalis TaxID=35019 RepID=A0A6I9Z118_9SAUR|nr:PREDICTED: E3 ubiquitin-protein ligase SMURF1 [Thamnophis sirtalis]
MSNAGTRRPGSSIKVRLTVLCAKNLAKKDFFRLPDPFAKIVVDGSGQCHSTDTVKNTLDPKWNQHYDLYVGKSDSITISVWNHKKIHKKQGAGFLGCVRLLSNAISRLKDTGYQRLDLCKLNPTDTDAVRGQIVVSLQTRDRIGTGGSVVDCRGLLENEGEWLYLLCHEMLNPYYGLFQYSTDNIYTLQINPDSSINPDHLSYFHFVGRIMGLAVFHGHYINGGFTVPFYKQLLGKPIQLSDLESVDPELHKSLVWILENDITPVLDHTFCVEHNAFGRILQHELKPNGRNVSVTEENKKEYVRLYVNWRFMRGIEAQFLALQKGFNELIPQHLLKPFDHKELELIIGGLDKIDLNDWKSNTRLKHCMADSNIVKWFWQAVEAFDEERRARLLQFVTGSTRVPLQGFKALQGAAGPRLFTIHLIDANTDNLPKAHTCFNRIDIPPYESYEKLYEKLVTAVEETCGFAVE